MKKVFNYSFFSFCLLLVSGCAQKTAIVLSCYEKGALLKFNFIPGQVLKYKQTTEMSITAEVKGIPQTMYSSTELTFTETVEDTGETVSLKITFDDASGTTRVSEQMETIKEIEEIIGKSISLKLSREGKVIETKGLKEIDYFRKQGKDATSQFEQSFGFLPNKVVKQGETWEKKFSANPSRNGTGREGGSASGGEDATATYILQSFEQKNGIDCAKIEGKENTNYTEDIDIKGIKGKVEIAGTSKETIFFAIKDGIILESKSTASVEGEQNITLASGEAMKIPIYMDMKMRTTLIR